MTRIHWFSLLCCLSLALACSSPSGQASTTQAKSSAKQYPNFGAPWYAGQAEITFRPGKEMSLNAKYSRWVFPTVPSSQ